MRESRKVLVGGTGRSGIAASRLILKKGGEVLLYDEQIGADRDAILANFEEGARVRLILGELKQNDLAGVHLAVLSPGIPLTAPFIKTLDQLKIPVIGELELAYQNFRGKIAAITGTNGKTTTTALTGEILKTHFKSTFVAGNIGEPLSDVALSADINSAAAVEVSSFMLETISDFRPSVSAILNITPDHLDRHLNMENYVRCKEAITMNQTESDFAVLNFMDPALREFGGMKGLLPSVCWFSSGEEPEGDALFLRGEDIYIKGRDIVEPRKLINTGELQILGRHNHENAMAAAAVGIKMGVPVEKVVEALRNFRAVEHRIEFVRERCKVKYFNDSKGTNTDAATKALLAMPGPTVLIAGGYDKHSEYDDWVRLFDGRVKKLILLGATRDDINACCRKHGFTEITYADDMDEAVKTAASYADEGDCVLLSPACASWGMFKNFEERGRIFKELVMEL